MRLTRSVPDDGGIDREAAVGGVLVEGALQDRVVAVRPGDSRAKIVEEMPEINGLDLVRVFDSKPQVVLVTGSPGYAADAFQLEVAD